MTTLPAPAVRMAEPPLDPVLMFTSCMVTLAVAFSAALMVTVLVVGVLLLDWVMTGASSLIIVSP